MSRMDPFYLFLIFKFNFIDFKKAKFKFADFIKAKFKLIDFAKTEFNSLTFQKSNSKSNSSITHERIQIESKIQP